MQLVLLTALGVGGATVIGALIGFLFRKISHSFSDIIMGFAAGVMLSAAVIGLILPSLEHGNKPTALIVTVIGIFCGALCLDIINKFVPHLHGPLGKDHQEPHNNQQLHKVLLFVMAIGIHNLP